MGNATRLIMTHGHPLIRTVEFHQKRFLARRLHPTLDATRLSGESMHAVGRFHSGKYHSGCGGRQGKVRMGPVSIRVYNPRVGRGSELGTSGICRRTPNNMVEVLVAHRAEYPQAWQFAGLPGIYRDRIGILATKRPPIARVMPLSWLDSQLP